MNNLAEEILKNKLEEHLGDLNSALNIARLMNFPMNAVTSSMETYGLMMQIQDNKSILKMAELHMDERSILVLNNRINQLETELDKRLNKHDVLICENCKEYWIGPKERCTCGSTSLSKTHQSNYIYAKKSNDFDCYEIWRPNIPDYGCTKQCKECAEKQANKI